MALPPPLTIADIETVAPPSIVVCTVTSMVGQAAPAATTVSVVQNEASPISQVQPVPAAAMMFDGPDVERATVTVPADARLPSLRTSMV